MWNNFPLDRNSSEVPEIEPGTNDVATKLRCRR